jgi:hypothetical protein
LRENYFPATGVKDDFEYFLCKAALFALTSPTRVPTFAVEFSLRAR